MAGPKALMDGRSFAQSDPILPWPLDRIHEMGLHDRTTERRVLWRMLEALAEVPTELARLFPSPADRRRYGPELQNYIRQARVYDDAARSVADISRGLLQYYSVLQLAKAELLVHRPQAVFNKRIAHGLSFSPEAAAKWRGDRLRIVDGVFRELYELRTGLTAPGVQSTLGVVDLLRSCPDTAFETLLADLGPPRAVPIATRIAYDGTMTWGLVDFQRPEPVSACRSTMTYLRSHLRPISTPHQLRHYVKGALFETRAHVARTSTPVLTMEDATAVSVLLRDALRPLSGVPVYGSTFVAPSQLKSSFRPVPPDLARYALIFYLSSLVRYKPSRLDRSARSEARWVLDAFSEEAGLHLPRAAYEGITGTRLQLNWN